MSEFVYMNLNTYAVPVRTSYGVPLVVPPNKAVKGEFYARFAAPNGTLSMVLASNVAPSAIIYEETPKDEAMSESWTRAAQKADPFLVPIEAPEVPQAAEEAEEVSEPQVEEETSPEPVEAVEKVTVGTSKPKGRRKKS